MSVFSGFSKAGDLCYTGVGRVVRNYNNEIVYLSKSTGKGGGTIANFMGIISYYEKLGDDRLKPVKTRFVIKQKHILYKVVRNLKENDLFFFFGKAKKYNYKSEITGKHQTKALIVLEFIFPFGNDYSDELYFTGTNIKEKRVRVVREQAKLKEQEKLKKEKMSNGGLSKADGEEEYEADYEEAVEPVSETEGGYDDDEYTF